MQTSKKAPGYFVPVDENGNIGMVGSENPFSTAVGQMVTSERETFWARMARHGRFISFGTADRYSLTDTSGNVTWLGPSMQVEPGFLYYPKFVSMSSNIDVELIFKIVPGFTPTGITPEVEIHYYSAFCKAGTPFIVTFDGEIWCNDSGSNGNQPGIYMGYRNASASTGYFYVSCTGFEVAKNA